MPNLENAKKALRQSVKRAARNTLAHAEIKSLRVKLRKLLAAKQTAEAKEVARMLGKKMDKALARGILKANTVARTKSRLMHHVNTLTK